MDLFLSPFETKIDSKDRVSIPARFRSLLERKNEDLILFTSPGDNFIQGCGNQYIERLWEAIESDNDWSLLNDWLKRTIVNE